MPRRVVFMALLLGAFIVSHASAHPVSYQGALSVMTWNQPYMTDLWTTYSYRWNAALAARYMRMDMEDGSEMKIYLPQADFLLYRKNGRNYQANLYAYGGYGKETMAGESDGVGLLGIEADAENRKYYSAVGFQSILPGLGPNIYQTTARLGVAAYEAEFNELGTWLIAQYQANPQLSLRQDLTPLVRLMYRNVLAEAGVGVTHGDWLLNFMVHF
jgi:hypothetical protein